MKRRVRSMQRMALALLTLWCVAVAAQAQKKYAVYAVGFYNQENLFDTQHDEGKNDYEYLPEKGWDELKYTSKVKNMARVIAEMGTDVLPQVGCALIGLSEVENARVLDDLTGELASRARTYNYVHIEGPDKRGIDCALLYNPHLFNVTDAKLVPYRTERASDSTFITRGFLTVSGRMADEDVVAIVCHWPSRFSVGYYRELAAKQVKAIKDSILAERPAAKVMVMGDMNDDPTNKSMKDILRALPTMDEVGEGDMYNPWYNLLAKEGKGTLAYQGSWNLFDQIVLTPNMVTRKGKKDYSTLKYFKHQIFRKDYMMQQEGQYKGSPLRTKAGGRWLNGYSDHLPVVVYLIKERP